MSCGNRMSDYIHEPAPCGFGAFGTCCCTCTKLLKLVDKCHHLGGTRKCGESPDGEFVCLVFAQEGLAQKWEQHGMCEEYTEKTNEK